MSILININTCCEATNSTGVATNIELKAGLKEGPELVDNVVDNVIVPSNKFHDSVKDNIELSQPIVKYRLDILSRTRGDNCSEHVSKTFILLSNNY